MRVKYIVLCFFVFFGHLNADWVDIVSFFSLSYMGDLPQEIKFRELTINQINDSYPNEERKIDKCIIVNYTIDDNSPFLKLPKEKLIFMLWEPHVFKESYYDYFSKVYTWDDNFVDNIKFFKIFYPFNMPMINNIPDFNKKKLFTMVAANWTPLRIQIIAFFEQMPKGEFECYGYGPPPIKNSSYVGQINGYHSGNEKFNVLKKYRFCFCFENSSHPGYITEKIFGCFASGCIPIYWGAPNITDYIPKECFIDYRDFNSDYELYQYLKSMDKDVYNEYLDNIREFLKSENGYNFSRAKFEAIFYDAITS